MEQTWPIGAGTARWRALAGVALSLSPQTLSGAADDVNVTDFVRKVDEFSKYGFEEDSVAVAEVRAYAHRKPHFLLELYCLDEVIRYFGAELVLSRFGVVKKCTGGLPEKKSCWT